MKVSSIKLTQLHGIVIAQSDTYAENEKGDEKGDIGNEAQANSDMEIIEDEGANNLDIMLDLIEQQERTQQRKNKVKELMHKFVADIDSRIELDTQLVLGWLT